MTSAVWSGVREEGGMAGLVGRMESIFEDNLVSIRVNEQSFAKSKC